ALFVACATHGPVTRVADGETWEGRSIAPEAYAAYLRASVLEARGDARGAVLELERALDEDPDSPEIVTRIARLLCLAGATSREAAEEAMGSFDDALALDPTYAPAWLGLSECRERRGDFEGALKAAERGAYYDPESASATRAVARLLFALGRHEEGFVWLEALVALSPDSLDAGQALLDAARARRDVPRETRALRAVSALGRAEQPARELAFDEALAASDLPRARALATGLAIAPSAVAVRALDASSPRLALEQAKLVLSADPSDSDAWIVALAASDELGDEAAFSETVRLLDPEPLPPSARAREIFEKLVVRRVGATALQRNP
ncbi:MAG TPA: tetratricopeptide repeat protein, partial [Polyangiaceae bacterium]